MDVTAVVVATVGALFGGGIVGIVQARAQNRRTTAEAEVTLGGGWQILVSELRAEMNEMRERVAVAEKRASDSETREAECQDRLAKVEQKQEHVSEEHVERVVVGVIEAELAKRGVK
jgi:hypothetical protein